MNPALQQDLGKLLLRITLGVLILLHGIAKLNGGLSGITGMVEAQGLPGFLGYAVLIGEVVAPLMLIAGFHARIGGLLVAVNMLVAIVLAHMGQLASLNGQGGWALELQGMFLGTALVIALIGPGRFSVNGR
ncbi:DoxX family membrane protein [Lysobacter sp. F60174L2]|uniref:DoxX family membrane protein n=1 Tax=Lysobacter sp. F60174L2 TaxID=3459295 RepID=UPI00403D9551